MRSVFSGIIAIGIIWCSLQLITVNEAKEVVGAKLYRGILSSVECDYIKSKNKSRYILHVMGDKPLSFYIGKHQCDKVLLGSQKKRAFEAYFLGGLPLDVKIDSHSVVPFEKGRSSHNAAFIGLLVLMVLSLVYVQFIFIKKRKK